MLNNAYFGGTTGSSTPYTTADVAAIRRATHGNIFGGQVPVLQRAQLLTNVGASTNATFFTSTKLVHMWWWSSVASCDAGDLRFVFGNFGVGSNSAIGDVVATGNPIWVSGQLYTITGALAQGITFDNHASTQKMIHDFGTASGASFPAPIAFSDVAMGSINAGDSIDINIWVMVHTIGDLIPTSLTLNAALGSTDERRVDGNWSFTGGSAASTNTAGYHPLAVIGTPLKGTIYSYSIIGDSISQGVGDTTLVDGGFFRRAMEALPRPYQRTTGSGSQLTMWADPATPRSTFLSVAPMFAGACRVVVIEQGINDVVHGQTDAQMYANMRLAVKKAVRCGAEQVVVCTLMPSTQSKNGFASTAGQSLVGTGSTPTSQQINACTNATPSVATTTAAHGLTDGNQIFLNGLGNIPTGFYYAKETGFTTSTFGIYNDAGLTSPVTGSGSFTSTTATVSGPALIAKEAYRWAYNVRIRNLSQLTTDIQSDCGTDVKVWHRDNDLDLATVLIAGAVGVWPANGTTDGAHPTAAEHITLSTNLQSLITGSIEAGVL